MTMARNHLSELANKGRYGDTEVRIIDNDYAHVNKAESIVIDEYGDKGFNWVKNAGAGTINPETGKKEHFWPAVMGIAAIGGLINNNNYLVSLKLVCLVKQKMNYRSLLVIFQH